MAKRTIHLLVFLAILMFTIIGRLLYIQLIDESYSNISKTNSVKEMNIIPARGEVVDRRGYFLAQSRESYDLLVTPRELGEFDTTLVCEILEIEKERLIRIIDKAKKYSYLKPSLALPQIEHIAKLRFDEMGIRGFSTRYRTVRYYPHNTAGNILGYIGEVNYNDLDRDEYYNMGDYLGKTDVEKRYEKLLRGEKGKAYSIVDAYGRYQGKFRDGEMDVEPKRGSTLTLSIDHKLQKLAEELMAGKVGSVVAIEPSTGEILAMVSSPTFNPDTLIGSNRSRNYKALASNPRKPLFNRSINAAYPPGSTFKMAMGLIALQEGVTNETERFYCNGGFRYKRLKVGCHAHYSPLAMEFALQTSCNAYFCEVFRRVIQNKKYPSVQVAYDKWVEYLHSFGFGKRLNSDVYGEASGFVPTSEFYDRAYNGRWNSLSVISLAIGQAELSVTPLQLANFTAILANRGFYYTPHLLKKVDGVANIESKYQEKHKTMVDERYFSPVVEAMWKSVNIEGTGAMARVEGLDICGKTGTAQNSRGDDHSTFVAFAPKNNPKIAVAAYVEHGRWGATAALPIVSLMIEQYLNDTITRPWMVENMKNMSLNYPQYDKQQ